MDHQYRLAPNVNSAVPAPQWPSIQYAGVTDVQQPEEPSEQLYDEPSLIASPDPRVLAMTYGRPPTLATAPAFFRPLVASSAVITGSTVVRGPALLPAGRTLPSQRDSTPTVCMVCGRSQCRLDSHRQYGSRTSLIGRARDGTTGSWPGGLSGPTGQIRHGRLDEPRLMLDPGQAQMLSLWSQPWTRTGWVHERHLFPTRFIDRILTIAQKHAALLNALLAYAGVIWSSNHGILDPAVQRQQMVAINTLSVCCPTPQLASTDEGITAAIFLLLIYATQGSGAKVQTHVDGLVHLVELRGGIHHLGLSGLCSELLLYADHVQAIYFDRGPIWPIPLPPLETVPDAPLGAGFRSAVASGDIDIRVGHLASSMCKLVAMLDGSTSDRRAFGYVAQMTDYQLALCNSIFMNTSTVNECICLALLRLNLVVLQQIPMSHVLSRVEYRFWKAMAHCEGNLSRRTVLPGLYMWLLVTGLVGGLADHGSSWNVAVQKLHAARTMAGIMDWTHFRATCLDYYLWLPVAQEELCQRIWAEVEDRSGESMVEGSSV